MTDRVLLEKAAKAAGYRIEWGGVFQFAGDKVDCSDLCWLVDDQGQQVPWDPLADDGDALRLAVRLHIDLRFYRDDEGHFREVLAEREYVAHEQIGTEPWGHSFDEPAATRRAIVRAAASLTSEGKDRG